MNVRERRLRRDRRSLARVRPRDPSADARGPGRPREGARARSRRSSSRRSPSSRSTTTRSRSGLRSPGERAPGFGTLTDLYVDREDRRSGVGTDLMREVLTAFRERGIEQLDLEVVASNAGARSLYARWGLRDEVVIMTGSIEALEAKLGRQEAALVRLDPHPDRRPSARSSTRSASSSRAFPAARAGRWSHRRGTGGSPSTTTSATAIRTCCAGSRASSRTGWVR